MVEHSLSFEKLAARFDRPLPSYDRVRTALASTPFVLAGYGSLARPTSGGLAARGARRITVIDPKSYGERSVHSQCDPHEVGRAKVAVGAVQLASFGVGVRAYERDLYDVPDGVVDPNAIVIATVDNRRADIGANRLAARMRARLLKLNIEPEEATAAVRGYDFRTGVAPCAECQFRDRHYDTQRHPHSCDGAADGRPTNSPRWLSETAAHLGVLAAIDLALDDASSSRWINSEWQLRTDSSRIEQANLSNNPNCRWDHAHGWQNVERLSQGPAEMALCDLFGSQPGHFNSSARIRFCQSVALAGTCGECGRQARVVRWTCDSNPAAAIAVCRRCQGPVLAQGYWKFSELPPVRLSPVWDRPLSDWGVEPLAVFSLRCDGRECTFVVGDCEH